MLLYTEMQLAVREITKQSILSPNLDGGNKFRKLFLTFTDLWPKASGNFIALVLGTTSRRCVMLSIDTHLQINQIKYTQRKITNLFTNFKFGFDAQLLAPLEFERKTVRRPAAILCVFKYFIENRIKRNILE
jgi:hypothetical protein